MNKNYFDENGNLVNVENKSLAEIYMDGAKQNRWIPCSDRLPVTGTDVIVYYPYWQDSPVQIAHLQHDYYLWETSDGEYNLPAKAVTHWMPLPEHPKEGADNG